MPDKQPFREDGKSIAEKHGVFAVEARGESALAPAEVESLRELRADGPYTSGPARDPGRDRCPIW